MYSMARFIPDMKLVLLLIAVLAAPCLAERQDASAQDAPAGTAPVTPVIDPVADRMLKEMSKTLSSAKAFKFIAAINFDQLLVSGQQIQYSGVAALTVKRPDKVFAEYAGDLDGKRIWYSGKDVTVLDVDKKFYGKLPVPANIDDAMESLMAEYGFTLPLSDVVVSDPYKAFVTNVAAGVVIGDSTVDGESCKHLAFVEKFIDWQIWISNGAHALPCKLVITYKTLPGGPQYSAVFSDWAVNPVIDASVFTPVLPEGAEQISFIKVENNQ